MKRLLFIIAALVVALSGCGDKNDNSAANNSGQTTAGTQNTEGRSPAGDLDLSDDDGDGKIDKNGDDGRTAGSSATDGSATGSGMMHDAGNAVDDAANGVGNAAKDVVDGAEDVVDDMTGNSNRTVNNNN